jgi:P27 family predicted phage terminase small subunit
MWIFPSGYLFIKEIITIFMEAKKIYKKYDKQVIEYMSNLISRLESQYGQINEEWRVSLDLIAFNYDIIRKCQEDIQRNGLEKVDDRGRLSKNPALSTVNQAQGNLFKLLNSFGLNLLSKSKIKNDEMEDDGLNDLLQ